MFGTISHVKMKPGHEKELEAFDEEFLKTVRPAIDGPIMMLRGRPHDGAPGETVSIFLCKDSATYWKLADSKEMDALATKMMEHYDGEPAWEDVQIDAVYQD